MRTALLAGPILLAACGAPPAPAAPAASQAVTAAPAPSLATTAAPAGPPRPAAKLGAPIDGRFGLAVTCDGPPYTTLHVWPVGKGLLGVCGSAVHKSSVFYVPESGPARLAPEVFKDLPMGGTNEGSTYGITKVSGADLDHLEAEVTALMTRSGVSYRFRKDGRQWKKMGEQAFASDNSRCDGSCITLGGRDLVFWGGEDGVRRFRYLDDKPGWLPGPAKAPGCDEVVGAFERLATRGPHLWGIGSACGKLTAQRWTIGGSETEAQSMPIPIEEDRWGNLWEVGARWFYATSNGRGLALFDGKAWHALMVLPETKVFHVNQVRDQAWIEVAGRLYRLEGTRLVEVAVPASGVDLFAASPSGEIRVWTGEGLYQLGAEDVWHPVTLPAGAPLYGGLGVIQGRWSYDVKKGMGLVMEGASGPALEIVNPESALSPLSFVRPFRFYCERPFALLYKLSRVAPKDYDFPATRKALEGQAELAAARFSELSAFGDRYLIARFDGGRARERLTRLSRLVEQKVQGAKPQLLCADAVPGELPTTRDVSMR